MDETLTLSVRQKSREHVRVTLPVNTKKPHICIGLGYDGGHERWAFITIDEAEEIQDMLAKACRLVREKGLT